MKKHSKRPSGKNIGSHPGVKDAVGIRIIGGRFRGSALIYGGDNRVRPMKDRTREAVFNLIGPRVREMHVIDLFGGTGAMTIEAISRGAVSGTVIEMHLPTAALLRQNLVSLDLQEICVLRKTDAFYWAKNREEHPQGPPWLVFCSPPYHFYETHLDSMREMLKTLRKSAPGNSLFVIESEERFDHTLLDIPIVEEKIRVYTPAKILFSET